MAEFTDYEIKPNFKTLGKRFGPKINKVKEILAGLDGAQAMAELDEKNEVKINLDGLDEFIAREDLVIESKQTDSFVSETDRGITVVIDTNLTEELIEEGFVRELISKIQTMRKDADYEVMDHIRVYVDGNDRIRDIFKNNEESIKHDVLATEVAYDTKGGQSKEWSINGETVVLGTEKL